MTTATTIKIRPVDQHMIDEEGFYLAKVTMYRQDMWTREATDIVDTFVGVVKESDSGIVWMVRPEASMRSNFKKAILTVSQRLISVEKVA